MKAAVFEGVGKPLSIQDVPRPAAKPNELVVKVDYCGVCGTDLHATREGLTTAAEGQILGHEYVGKIVEVGPEALGDWQVGDRVCSLPFIACGNCDACHAGRPYECQNKKVSGVDAQGAYAEYVAAGGQETIKLPDDLDSQAAALIEPLAVGLHAVRMADVQPGSRVLVIGAGPIGLTVALWARFYGAESVVVSERADSRAALAQKMGATAVMRPAADADAETLAAQYAELTGGAPEVIFECVGAPGLLQQCIEIAGHGGQIVPVGVCEQPDAIMPMLGLFKELRIQFAIAYTMDDFQTAMSALAEQRIDVQPMITDIVTLDELPAAFEALRTPQDQCKVLIKID